MSFPDCSSQWGFELLAEMLTVLQPLPQGAFCKWTEAGGACPKDQRVCADGEGKKVQEGDGTLSRSQCCSVGQLGQEVQVSGVPPSEILGATRAESVGACAPDRVTNFILFAVIGRAISVLTSFLFNLAFAAAAACSRLMDFYLRASWFGGKDITSRTCMCCGSLL